MIGENVAYMTQQIAFYLQRAFFPIKDKLEKTNKYSDQRLDVLAASNLAMQMLNGCATADRRLILRLSMHIIFQMPSVTDAQIEDIKDYVRRLDLICDLEENIARACDCSFFYWSRVMVPTYFQDIFNNPEKSQRLQYMFAAFRDIIPYFSRSVHIETKEFLKIYSNEVNNALKVHIIKPLCESIEIDLRYHIHSHLDVEVRDPFKKGVKDLTALVNIKPLRFFDRTISLESHVTHYLDKNFYNLTTVAMYDWKTYAEMRNLAREKYGLNLTEVHLPGQTLEQGVDILEIMRRIHVFVSHYYYNLNNQIFIEKHADSKFLNTVNIGHIANSIRTHGAGIMNTTVNFTYQFLRQKFVIFSQFLYDDHIKSRLYKDVRFFKDNKEELESRYPFDRAERFNREIRKLGVGADGSSYLDQFRILITEIGNAMGYIRMVRSGGLQYTSNAIKFVPDLQDLVKFENDAKKDGLSVETQEAAKNLDSAIENLRQNFAEGTDYFKMLVGVFAPEFRSEQNMHLRNFFIITPPLFLNYVEHMLINKDKMKNKKGQQTITTCFTDDGFAIGVAYILKLLNQNVDFDSLHWFESVTQRYTTEQDKLQGALAKAQQQQQPVKGKKAPPPSEKATEEQQTALLTLKKLKAYQMEFELLRFSFSGSRIFFKD